MRGLTEEEREVMEEALRPIGGSLDGDYGPEFGPSFDLCASRLHSRRLVTYTVLNDGTAYINATPLGRLAYELDTAARKA